MISALDVKGEFRERLEAAGLWDKLDLQESQFLDLPPQVFVELVVYDAGLGNKVADVANDIRLAHPDEEMVVVVRAHWQVHPVVYAGYALGLSGAPLAAERFDVVLASGSVTRRVVVDVTTEAISYLKSRLPAGKLEPLAHRRLLQELVRGFVELELSQGGTSYWDPVRFPTLELNSAAVQYMIGHQLFKVEP